MSRRKRKAWFLGAGAAAVLLGAALVAGYGYMFRAPKLDTAPLENYYRALRPPAAQGVDLGALRAAIQAATGHLKRANLDSGQFIYAVNLDPSVPVVPGYNLLRHAGAIYALGMSHAVAPDPEAVRVMRRASDFMRACCFTRFEGQDMLAVWEPPQLAGWQGPAQYKLGGAALGLAALVSLANASPGSVPEAELQALARFGRFMMRWDGEFYSLYVPGGEGRTLRGVSLFYPGEMALAWLMLYERAPSPELIESAVTALSFLARERAVARSAPIDHWALLATARLFQIAFLPPSHPVTPHAQAAAHRGIGFLMQAQVMQGPQVGGMPSDIGTLPDDGSEPTRKFNAQATEIRIDYVQHALSAMLQYLAWMTAERAVQPTK